MLSELGMCQLREPRASLGHQYCYIHLGNEETKAPGVRITASSQALFFFGPNNNPMRHFNPHFIDAETEALRY